MTLRSPQVRPGFAGCMVPVDRRQRSARQLSAVQMQKKTLRDENPLRWGTHFSGGLPLSDRPKKKTPRLGLKEGANYNDVSAPFIYFDAVVCHGAIGGVVELELAARTLAPTPDGTVYDEYVPVARLRCGVVAAEELRRALETVRRVAQEIAGATTRPN
jgi:hypothetical protein